MRGTERSFINAIPKHERDAKLFVFYLEDGEFWHFVNARSSGSRLELRRFSITPLNRNRLRTTQDRLALLKVSPSDTTQILIDKMKSAFDVGGSSIFLIINDRQLLGNFVCKITKYIAKTWIDHTVNFQVDENKELPILISYTKKLQDLVEKIIENQKQNPRYDYMSNEQKEIDKLVYETYGLNKDDIREVEVWYARRYPKLARFCDID